MTDHPDSTRINDESSLRALHKTPRPRVYDKELPRLDKYCRQFIGLSPFLCLSTADKEGQCDASPRGDAPGFVEVVDDRTLLIPDRRGNNRLDSFSNILKNPHVGLLFLVPGMNEMLRVNGIGSLIADPDLLRHHEVKGKVPKVGLKVSVETAYFHCGKSALRSGLWDAETQVDRSVMPGLGRIVAEQAAEMKGETITDAQGDEADQAIADAYRTEVY